MDIVERWFFVTAATSVLLLVGLGLMSLWNWTLIKLGARPDDFRLGYQSQLDRPPCQANAIGRDEIVACQFGALKQHHTGKLAYSTEADIPAARDYA
jgi:hypothetical protein